MNDVIEIYMGHEIRQVEKKGLTFYQCLTLTKNLSSNIEILKRQMTKNLGRTGLYCSVKATQCNYKPTPEWREGDVCPLIYYLRLSGLYSGGIEVLSTMHHPVVF